MDDAFLQHYAKPPEQRKPMTPDMFRAMAEGKRK